MENDSINQRTWNEFRDTGLLWFINTVLHMFGWAITFNIDNSGSVVNVYPSRVKFRGFSEKINSNGYAKVSHYLQENIDILVSEVEE